MPLINDAARVAHMIPLPVILKSNFVGCIAVEIAKSAKAKQLSLLREIRQGSLAIELLDLIRRTPPWGRSWGNDFGVSAATIWKLIWI